MLRFAALCDFTLHLLSEVLPAYKHSIIIGGSPLAKIAFLFGIAFVLSEFGNIRE